jgi:hypothetical protein
VESSSPFGGQIDGVADDVVLIIARLRMCMSADTIMMWRSLLTFFSVKSCCCTFSTLVGELILR